MQKTKEVSQLKKLKKGEREKFYEELVEETVADFKKRQAERVGLERQWQLNFNFYVGNQYKRLNSRLEIEDNNGDYFWQNREVFNHIAPIIDTRLSKFSHIEPTFSIRPKTDDDSLVSGAKVCENALNSLFQQSNAHDVIKKVTSWSEICGTGFYKVVWDNDGGCVVGEYAGKKVYDGEVKIIPVSPFEIYPDNLQTEDIDDCFSIIHARLMNVREIKEKYGVVVMPEQNKKMSIDYVINLNDEKDKKVDDCALVIEKYCKPTEDFPKGRLITVANGKLLYYGELPYENGENERRTFPFIKQESMTVIGSFFGRSIIERLIPIQRSYNAVKNRKHEFINRLSSGVMMVEDGSVDVDDLESEGLPPGKILVYRQGAKEPEMMTGLSMPSDFNQEEENLLQEFILVSGISDVSVTNSSTAIKSGVALELLIEQNNEKLLIPVERIRNSYIAIAKQVIRLYAQFLSGVKIIKYYDQSNKLKISYFDKSAVSSDDVYIESENELLYSDAEKKELLFKLNETGLLNDETGKIKPSVKEKVLTLMGYKDLDGARGVYRLQEEKAIKENQKLKRAMIDIEEIDDDGVHITEHTRYVLSEYEEMSKEQKETFNIHIKQHKQRLNKKLEIKV